MQKKELKQVVRALRKNQTKAEEVFWAAVRNRKVAGRKFFRQHPIKLDYYGEQRFFIVDFYCPEQKLAVEIDGKVHEKQEEYDRLRTYIIEQMEIEVIRFSNDEIQNNIAEALVDVVKYFHV